MIKPPHFQLKAAIARQLFCSPVFIERAFDKAEADLTGDCYRVAVHRAWDAADAFISEMEEREKRDLELYSQGRGFQKLSQQVYQMIKDGLTGCSDIAKAIGVSKGQVSKIASLLIKGGKIAKHGKEYIAT